MMCRHPLTKGPTMSAQCTDPTAAHARRIDGGLVDVAQWRATLERVCASADAAHRADADRRADAAADRRAHTRATPDRRATGA